MQPDTLLNPM